MCMEKQWVRYRPYQCRKPSSTRVYTLILEAILEASCFTGPLVYHYSSAYFKKMFLLIIPQSSDSSSRHVLIDVSISLHSIQQHLKGTFLQSFFTLGVTLVLDNHNSHLTDFTVRDSCPLFHLAMYIPGQVVLPLGILNSKVSFCKHSLSPSTSLTSLTPLKSTLKSHRQYLLLLLHSFGLLILFRLHSLPYLAWIPLITSQTHLSSNSSSPSC